MGIIARAVRGRERIDSSGTGLVRSLAGHESLLRFAGLPVLFALAAQLSGCGSIGPLNQTYLYDQGRDQQAKAAKTAWDAVKLDDVFKADQDNLGILLSEELKAQDDLGIAIRDYRLRSLLTAPLLAKERGLQALIEARLNQLAGLGATPDAVLRVIASQLTVTPIDAITPLRIAYQDAGLGVPRCTDAVVPRPAPIEAALQKGDLASKELSHSFHLLEEGCTALPQLKGEVGQAYVDYGLAQAAKREAEKKVADRTRDYQEALKSYNDAVKTNKDSDPGQAKAALGDEAGKLLKALDAVEQVQNAFSLKFVAQTKLDALSTFLDAINKGVAAGAPASAASAPKSAGEVVLVAGFIDDARSKLADAKTPLNQPFQIYRDQQQLRVQAAQVDVDAQQRGIELLLQIGKTKMSQAQELALADRELNLESSVEGKVVHMKRFATIPFNKAYASANSLEQKVLLSAARRYLNVIYGLDAQAYKLEYQLVAAQYDRMLAYSAADVKQWESLISATSGQVADFYAGGVQPGTIAALLQAGGVVWGAKGLNK